MPPLPLWQPCLGDSSLSEWGHSRLPHRQWLLGRPFQFFNHIPSSTKLTHDTEYWKNCSLIRTLDTSKSKFCGLDGKLPLCHSCGTKEGSLNPKIESRQIHTHLRFHLHHSILSINQNSLYVWGYLRGYVWHRT